MLAGACGGDDAETVADPIGPPLPDSLPSVGIAEPIEDGTRLVALDGAVLAELPGVVIHSNTTPGGPLYVYGWHAAEPQRYGPTLRLDPSGPRWVEEDAPDEPGADVMLPSVPAGTTLTGHWRWTVRSPVGDVRLAQWSGECEIPVAFFVDPDGAIRHVLGGDWLDAPNTTGLGWLPDGRALVAVASPDPGCGTGSPEPGVYAIDPDTGERARFEGIDGGIVWG